MSPIPTTSHGLVYPDSTGNVNLWEHFQSLAVSADTAVSCLIGSRGHVAATSISTSTWTSIPFDTVDLDEIPWDAANRWWTVAAAGYYQINAGAVFATNATGHRDIRIYLNSATVLATAITGSAASANGEGVTVSRCKKLSAGDHVAIQCFQNSGGGLALSPGNAQVFGDITLIGPA